jgi:hypothetical protein
MSLSELIEYFNKEDLPKTLQLNECEFCNDVHKVVESNISYLQSHPGNAMYMPYYLQLVEIKNRIEDEKKRFA